MRGSLISIRKMRIKLSLRPWGIMTRICSAWARMLIMCTASKSRKALARNINVRKFGSFFGSTI